MECKQINARPVCHEPISVRVITKKQPIGVKVLTGGTGGTVDLSPVYNAIASIRAGVSDNTTAITALRQDLTRLAGEQLTREQVQAMLDSIVIPEPVDLTPVNKQLEALDNRIDSTNKAINNLPVPLTSAEVQTLINKSLPAPVDLTPIQTDITDLKSKDTELSNSIESLSRSQLTEAQVNALIDTAIANIVDGEEVRY